MKIKTLINDLKKLEKLGIDEVLFCVGCSSNVPNDFCYFDINFCNGVTVLHNHLLFDTFI